MTTKSKVELFELIAEIDAQLRKNRAIIEAYAGLPESVVGAEAFERITYLCELSIALVQTRTALRQELCKEYDIFLI